MIEPTGPETIATVDTAVGKITARLPGNLHQAAGGRVHLRWDARAAHPFDLQTERRVA